jgi:hypothetical protein
VKHLNTVRTRRPAALQQNSHPIAVRRFRLWVRQVRIPTALALLWFAALLSGCYTGVYSVANANNVVILTPSAEAATPEPTPSPTLVPIPGLIGPQFPANVNPLTGLTADDPALLDRRPMVVTISNAPPLVRPQAGLNEADVIYEHYVEGGLTRFSAIFYSQAPTRIGSIRSARLIDYELVPMYDGLLAFSGASNGMMALLENSGFWERTYLGIWYGLPYYWRDETIEVPHNLFLNAEALWGLATEEGLNPRPNLQNPMTFLEALPPNSAGAATNIDIRYRATRTLWDYDPSSGRYRRTTDGLGHYDANTMEQVTAANVVVVYANHVLSDIVESEWQGSVTYGIEIQLWFEGDAILFRDGQRYRGRWRRPSREQSLSLYTDDGQYLPLKPGSTWIEVFPLPEQQDLEEESVTVR